jgi:hypothetical protein
MVRLDDKLARIRGGLYQRSDFIIADAKDPDMGPGLHAIGRAPPAARRRGSPPGRNFSIRSRRSSNRMSSTSC